MAWFCGELNVWEASVKQSDGMNLEMSYSKFTISAKYFQFDKWDDRKNHMEGGQNGFAEL